MNRHALLRAKGLHLRSRRAERLNPDPSIAHETHLSFQEDERHGDGGDVEERGGHALLNLPATAIYFAWREAMLCLGIPFPNRQTPSTPDSAKYTKHRTAP